jgi:hypothetical protein
LHALALACARAFLSPDASGQVQTEDGFIGRVVGRSAGGRFEVKIPGMNETRTMADAELMEPMPLDEMARILEDVGVLGFSAEVQKKRSGKSKPVITPKSPSPQKGTDIKDDTFVNDDESDVDTDDSLADIGSDEDEETAQKRLNAKPPKLEPEGNEWRCVVCRVINDEGIPKCIACDTKNPDYKGGESKPAVGGLQFGFGGGAAGTGGGFSFGTSGASSAAAPAASPVLKFGFGGAAPAPATSTAAAPAAAAASVLKFGFGGAALAPAATPPKADAKADSRTSSAIKAAPASKTPNSKAAAEEDFVNDDESDVDTDDSLADIGSDEDEETAQKRLNAKPPKLEPEGNEWRCVVCRVINDEGIPKCIACDTKNPDYKGGESKPAVGGLQFGFGGGAAGTGGGFSFGTSGASSAAAPAASPVLKFGFGGAAPAPATSTAAAPAAAAASVLKFGFGGAALAPAATPPKADAKADSRTSSAIKAAPASKTPNSKAAAEEDFVNDDESDVDTDDSLADIGSDEDEETAQKRLNAKPPKLEPEGNEWRCVVCRVINDEGIPKCIACDTKNPDYKGGESKPAVGGLQFGFGGGAAGTGGGFSFGTSGASSAAAPAASPVLKFGFGGAAPAPATSTAAAPAAAAASVLKFGFGGAALAPAATPPKADAKADSRTSSAIKAAPASKTPNSKAAAEEDFVNDDESDVDTDDSLADIGSDEDEETAQKRLNAKPPKLEPEGNEWRCVVCRVINDEGIPKCIACDTKNPDYKGGESKPAVGGLQFGFGGGAAGTGGGFSFGTSGASSAAAPAASPVLKFGFGGAAPAPATSTAAAPAAAAASVLKFGFGGAAPAPKASAFGETASPSQTACSPGGGGGNAPSGGNAPTDVSFGFGAGENTGVLNSHCSYAISYAKAPNNDYNN